jgi:hypothetical protein
VTPVVLQAAPRSPVRSEVRWTGGLSVSPVTPVLHPGSGSTGVRVLDFTWDGTAGSLRVEGLAGRVYQLRLVGDLPATIAPMTVVRAIPGGQLVEVRMPAGDGITRQVVQLAK